MKTLKILFFIVAVLLLILIIRISYSGLPNESNETIEAIYRNTEERNTILKNGNNILSDILKQQKQPIQIECID